MRRLLLAALLALPLIAAGQVAQAQTGPTFSVTLAAPGTAPDCLPTSNTFWSPYPEGTTSVLFRGRGFQPGERIYIGWVGGRPVFDVNGRQLGHDGLPVADTIVDASGRFACLASLDVYFSGTPYEEGFSASGEVTRGDDQSFGQFLDYLVVPAMPPAGSGGNADTPGARTIHVLYATSLALAALAIATRWRSGNA